jgi:uncharacterized membrane protein
VFEVGTALVVHEKNLLIRSTFEVHKTPMAVIAFGAALVVLLEDKQVGTALVLHDKNLEVGAALVVYRKYFLSGQLTEGETQ